MPGTLRTTTLNYTVTTQDTYQDAGPHDVRIRSYESPWNGGSHVAGKLYSWSASPISFSSFAAFQVSQDSARRYHECPKGRSQAANRIPAIGCSSHAKKSQITLNKGRQEDQLSSLLMGIRLLFTQCSYQAGCKSRTHYKETQCTVMINMQYFVF